MLFDSTGNDRMVTASDYAEKYNRLALDGYIYGFENELEVAATNPQTMAVRVNTGAAIVRGRYFEVFDEAETLTIPTADISQPRIDRIVIRLDNNTRTVEAVVKQGTAAATPSAPTLQQDAERWELSLAQVAVGANVTSIDASNITDERENDSLCGQTIARGVIAPNGENMMNGELNLDEHVIRNIRRLFYEDRINDAQIIGFTEAGDTGEMVFAYYNGNLYTLISTFAAINEEGTIRIDSLQGLANQNIARFGPPNGDGDKKIRSTLDELRVYYSDDAFVAQGETYFAIYFNAGIVHQFNENGTKVGGSIPIDGKMWGMSPTDSPRSLIEDVMIDVEVDGELEIGLDARLGAIMDRYTVFSSNPDIYVSEQKKFGFTLKGRGFTDLEIKGTRSDKPHQYFVRN